MKKHNRFFTALSILTVLLFTSCTDPVFYYINRDVKSEEATVFGTIRSIARYSAGSSEYLVTVGSNGLIYKRVCKETEAHGTWITIGADQLPFAVHAYDYTDNTHKGEQILKVVSDSTHLYIVTIKYATDLDEGTSYPEKIHIWTVQPTAAGDGNWNTISSSDWTEILEDQYTKDGNTYIPVYFYDEYYYTAFNVFSTNSVQKSHRSAYIRIGGGTYKNQNRKYYELSGGAINSTPVTISTVEDSTSTGENVNVNSAVHDGSGVIFFATEASGTNETAAADAGVIYYGDGKTFNYKKAGDPSYTQALSTDHTITALAICKDAVIIGCGEINSSNTSVAGGVEKVQLDSQGIPASTLGTFTTNAKTQLLSYYKIDYLLNTDPSQNELDSSIYAGMSFIGSGSSSSVSYNNIGLWSYYPGRGNWNRE